MQSTLEVKLIAIPDRLTMAERAQLRVGLEVTNHGPAAVDPQLAATCELLVNGRESVAWNLAVHHRARGEDDPWSMLPPGETLRIGWPLGEWLFTGPGCYHLLLRLAGMQVAADVRVEP